MSPERVAAEPRRLRSGVLRLGVGTVRVAESAWPLVVPEYEKRAKTNDGAELQSVSGCLEDQREEAGADPNYQAVHETDDPRVLRESTDDCATSVVPACP
jgi:hypothetical protein